MGAEQSTEAAPVPEAQAQTATDRQTPAALVICGPSGVGKGTLIRKLMEGNDKFGFSCSHTTRSPREGEQVIFYSSGLAQPGTPDENLTRAAEALSTNSRLLVASCRRLWVSCDSNGHNAQLTNICLEHPEWSPLLVHIQGAHAAANQGWQIPRDSKCPWPALWHISTSRPVSSSIWQILHSRY